MTTALERGAAIKRRRLALDIRSRSAFARAIGRDAETVKRAEEGGAHASTLDWVEAWLTRQERETSAVSDPVEHALAASGLPLWRQLAILSEYHRHRHEQAEG